jgi:hypothetical protein
MGGKAALLLVVGFSLTFLIVGQNFGSLSTRAVENLTDYYEATSAHNIAVSGANMAANEIFFDPTWTAGYNDRPFSGGYLDVSVNVLDAWKNIRQITSVGTFENVTQTVKVTLQPSKFSKFAYYSTSEGGTIWWTANDTVWGPFHTQDYLRASKHPVFFGKTTVKKKLIYYTSKKQDKPEFHSTYEEGVDLPLPTDGLSPIEAAADDDGHKFSGQDTVYITFVSDSITYKFAWNGVQTTVLGTAFAPNGVIFVKDAICRLKGTVKGQYTLATSGSGSRGTIYLDDNIVYDKDPRIYSNSTDLLGIVAKNKVLITNNAANNNSIDIHGSIYCESGGFGAQNYDSRPPSGNINLLGGIIQYVRQAVGQFSGTTITSGFAKRYRYDDRLMLSSPPMFPGTGGFEIVSWLE